MHKSVSSWRHLDADDDGDDHDDHDTGNDDDDGGGADLFDKNDDAENDEN